jgi:uncharacterized membrane protein YkvA (DUF1232 family)
MNDIPWGPLLITLLVVGVVVVLALLFALWRKYRFVRDPRTPLPAKIAFWGSIVYTVFPVDALPDPVLLDDIGVLAGALTYVSVVARKLRAPRDAEQA